MVLAIAVSVSELVTEPYSRIQEVGCQHFESRALFIAAERRILDLLDLAEEDRIDVAEIAEKTGIESGKLCKCVEF
jgi:hypothetical protein